MRMSCAFLLVAALVTPASAAGGDESSVAKAARYVGRNSGVYRGKRSAVEDKGIENDPTFKRGGLERRRR